jgi:hypothetical protein
MRHTNENEFGLLPTPTMFDYNSARTEEKWIQDKQKYAEKGINLQMALKQMAKLGMLPTPTTRDWKGPEGNEYKQMRGEHTIHKTNSIPGLLMRGMLPTPISQASRGNASDNRGKGNLTDCIAEMKLTDSKTSQLNPRFVAEMMGFPPNWTELPFQNGEPNQ